jgi:hypothetical protein
MGIKVTGRMMSWRMANQRAEIWNRMERVGSGRILSGGKACDANHGNMDDETALGI